MTTASARDDVLYVDSEIPPRMTVHEWRRQRPAARAASRSWRLRARVAVAVADARRVVVLVLDCLEIARGGGRQGPSLAGRAIHWLLFDDETPRLRHGKGRRASTVG